MNLVVTWKLNFATCLSFCGNRSHMFYMYHNSVGNKSTFFFF